MLFRGRRLRFRFVVSSLYQCFCDPPNRRFRGINRPGVENSCFPSPPFSRRPPDPTASGRMPVTLWIGVKKRCRAIAVRGRTRPQGARRPAATRSSVGNSLVDVKSPARRGEAPCSQAVAAVLDPLHRGSCASAAVSSDVDRSPPVCTAQTRFGRFLRRPSRGTPRGRPGTDRPRVSRVLRASRRSRPPARGRRSPGG